MGGVRERLSGGALPPGNSTRITLNAALSAANDAATTMRPAAAGYEKHRPSGVRTRRRQFPLIIRFDATFP